MTLTRGLCYVATDGYMFQTVVSAVQARSFLRRDDRTSVTVVHVGPVASQEFEVFAAVGESSDVRVIHRDIAMIEGLRPAYARLFLDLFLPDIDEFLYLDGDTQVLADVSPLLDLDPGNSILAVRDPMVLIRETSRHFRRRVNAWFIESGIAPESQRNYVNSGLLRLSRSTLVEVRAAALRHLQARATEYRFLDQDLLNVTMSDRIQMLPPRWNFPGFLLTTQVAERVTPSIVHFMSNPRPWSAPYAPWGDRFFTPYRQFVARYPTTASYWVRASRVERARYTTQQAVKKITERRVWQSREALVGLNKWQAETSPRGGDS